MIRRSLWIAVAVMLVAALLWRRRTMNFWLCKGTPGSGCCPAKTIPPTVTAPSSQITTRNVKNLKASWTFSLGVLRGQEGAPLVIGTTMYVHTGFPNNVYALDLTRDGAPIKWAYKPNQDPNVPAVACCDTVYTAACRMPRARYSWRSWIPTSLRIDAATGKEIWKVTQGDPALGMTITSAAPLVIKDKVITGISGGEFGVRGFRDRQRHQHRRAGLARLQRRPGYRRVDWRRFQFALREPSGRRPRRQHLGRG